MKPILHIAGYKFISLTDLVALQQRFRAQALALSLRGTVLLSEEGVNINVAGLMENVNVFMAALDKDPRFSGMRFHQSYTEKQTYQRLKVKIKKEIITLRQEEVDVVAQRAPAIAPTVLKQWLDEKREMTLLDTRNDFEMDYGAFDGAVNLHLHHFGEFPNAINGLDKEKPLVMCCTGGIRCEKAAIYMLKQGFKEVYQLDGGILGYFTEVGGDHYQGGCYVFDERVVVRPGN